MIWSILAILAASFLTLFLLVGILGFSEIIKRDLDEEIGFAFFLFIALVVDIFVCWGGASIHGWLVQLMVTALVTILSIAGMWIHRNLSETQENRDEAWNFCARLIARTKEFATTAYARFMKRDALVRRYAKKRVSQLIRLMPGVQ